MSYEPPPYGSEPPPPPGGNNPYGNSPYGAPPPGGGYGSPPPGSPYGAPPGYGGPAPQQTPPLAIIALVAGIAGILGACCCGFPGLLGIAGVVCGVLARKEIAESGGTKKGEGLALAGIITGALAIVLSIVGVLVYFVFGTVDTFNS